MANLDLNELRSRLVNNQSSGDISPSNPNKAVVVGKNGNVQLGDQVASDEAVTAVQQDTFACLG